MVKIAAVRLYSYTIDLENTFLCQLSVNYLLMYKAVSLNGASKVEVPHGPAYIIQGPHHQEELLNSPFPHETNTLVPLSDFTYHLACVDITTTSGYSVRLGRMVCYMISVITRHNAPEHSFH